MKVSTGKIHTIMKTKNIFLTAISALFIFAACTEEKITLIPQHYNLTLFISS